MRIASSVVALTLAALPSSFAQDCDSLCAGGGEPQNPTGVLPVPGVGDVSCDVAAGVIAAANLSPEECTLAQAGGFLICECSNPPEPNVNLPCAFCADGTLPTNPTAIIVPPVGIPGTGGEVSTCTGLVALASTLEAGPADAAVCSQIQSSYSETCGCAASGTTTEAPETVTTTGTAATTEASENATTAEAADTTTEATEANATTTEAAETNATTTADGEVQADDESEAPSTAPPIDVVLPEVGEPSLAPSTTVPTTSAAPSSSTDVESSVPTGDTSMPTASPVAEGGGLTPFPTAEPTSAASTASAMLGSAVLGMLVAMM